MDKIIQSEVVGMEIIGSVLTYYSEALQDIQRLINRFYDRYSEDGKLSIQEINKKLTYLERREFLQAVRPKLDILEQTVRETYSKEELAQLTRLQALTDEIEMDLEIVGIKEEDRCRVGFKEIIAIGYLTNFVVKTIKDKKANAILNRKWIDRKNWYNRVWKNNKTLKKEVEKVVKVGVNKGWSNQKMARMLDERLNVGKFRSTRLVRTESNYMVNQATLQRFKDDGMQYYRFNAQLDNRTSEICESLDGQVFKLEDASVGTNYPPMHANCRSTEEGIPDKTYLTDDDKV